MKQAITVYVNGRPIHVPPGCTALHAIEEFDRDLAALVVAGSAHVTDGVGRSIESTEHVLADGTIIRIIETAGGKE